MIKIYCNKECVNPNIKAHVVIKNNQVSVDVYHRESEEAEEFIRESHAVEIKSYSNYQLNKLMAGNFHVKREHKAYQQSVKFFAIQRFALASRSDYLDYHDLLPGRPLLQVDTGLVAGAVKDMAMKVIAIERENLEIESDIPWEMSDYTRETQINPRFTLWDRYAVKINEVEYQADHHGNLLSPQNNMVDIGGREYLDIEIAKYSNGFAKPLERAEDAEEVLLECSAGLINARRVYLENGKAVFRLYPFGYQGKFKLKLGWRWYPTWCEYNLVMG